MKKLFTTQLETELRKKMRVHCAVKETTIIDFVNEAIKEKLEREV